MPVVLPVAKRWFERTRIDDDITLLWEPHVIELMRCNIWHVRGRDRDLVIDTGMGVCSLVEELGELARQAGVGRRHSRPRRPHRWPPRVRRRDCASVGGAAAAGGALQTLDIVAGWGADVVAMLTDSGYAMDDPYFVDALPAGYVFEQYRQQPATGHSSD